MSSMRLVTRPRRRSVARRPAWWKPVLVIAGVCAGLGLFVGGRSGLVQLWKLHRREAAAQHQKRAMVVQVDSLRQELWLLENDLEYVEKVAREEYGMSKRSERVYRLRPEADAPAERR